MTLRGGNSGGNERHGCQTHSELPELGELGAWTGLHTRVVSGASISATSILGNLLLLVLIALAVGLFAHARYAEHAGAWRVQLAQVFDLVLSVEIGRRGTPTTADAAGPREPRLARDEDASVLLRR